MFPVSFHSLGVCKPFRCVLLPAPSFDVQTRLQVFYPRTHQGTLRSTATSRSAVKLREAPGRTRMSYRRTAPASRRGPLLQPRRTQLDRRPTNVWPQIREMVMPLQRAKISSSASQVSLFLGNIIFYCSSTFFF